MLSVDNSRPAGSLSLHADARPNHGDLQFAPACSEAVLFKDLKILSSQTKTGVPPAYNMLQFRGFHQPVQASVCRKNPCGKWSTPQNITKVGLVQW